MALKLNERYPGRFNNPSTDYPQGSFKNRTTPTAKDGSYLEKDWANDKEGFFQSLLSAAVVAANGAADKVGASQYFDAMKTVVSQAITAKIQSSATDTTAGRLLTVGAFGLGSTSPTFPGADLNNTAVNYNSTWGTSTGCLNAPVGWNVQGSIVKVDAWLTSGVIQQTFEEHITGRTARRAWSGTAWGTWDTVITTANIPASTETVSGILPIATATEVSTGLNDTKAVTPLKLATRVNSAIAGALSSTLGYNKSYTDVTASRSSGVSYTNNAGAPIQVFLSLDTLSGAETTTIVVGGFTVYSGDPGVSGQRTPIPFIVPNGMTYSVTVSGTTIQRWAELR